MPAEYRSPRLQDLVASERPQERLERVGPQGLSDTELLAMLLRKGTARTDVLGLAAAMHRKAGSLQRLLSWTVDDFTALDGVGKVKALQFLTVFEIAKRILKESADVDPVLDSPEAVWSYLLPHRAGLEVEKFWVLCLNRKHRLLRFVETTSGTASSSLVHPREVFREAIRSGASAVIVAHNHPSGDPSPSRADIQVTRQLREAAKIVGIDLLDHVICGDSARDPQGRGHYSFSEAGLV